MSAGIRKVRAIGETRMKELVRIYRDRFESMDCAAETKLGRRKALTRIARTWRGFEGLRPGEIAAVDVWAWANRLRRDGSGFRPPHSKSPARKGASASSVNQAVAALQHLLQIAVEIGAVDRNVALQPPPAGFGPLRKRAEPKPLHLPPQEVMQKLLDEIERPDGAVPRRIQEAQRSHRLDAGELCRFLAYSGARRAEAGRAVWGDDRGTYLIVRGTKSAKSRDRAVPVNPSLRALLTRIRLRRGEEAALRGAAGPGTADPILRVRKAKGGIARACRALGLPRLTHHDFRHLFATRCLESGVDPKTLAEWLGHADGGMLVFRTYGHVRQDHAIAAAAKVVF